MKFLFIFRQQKQNLIIFSFKSETYLKNSLINDQINIFLRHSDEFTYSNNDVDLNNHFDIFFAIYSQV